MNQAKETGRVSDTSDSNVTPMRRHPCTITTADVRDATPHCAQVRAMELLAALGAPPPAAARRRHHRNHRPHCPLRSRGSRGATAASIKAISSLMECAWQAGQTPGSLPSPAERPI